MSRPPVRPPRPAIPVTFWAFAVVVGCVRAVLSRAPGPGALAAAVGAAALLGGLACAALARAGLGGAVPVVAVVAAAVAAAALASGVELARQGSLAEALASRAVSRWEFELVGDMSEGAHGWRGRARALAAGASAGEVWLTCDRRLASGARVACVGRFEANGDDDWGRSSRMQGLAGTVRATHVLSERPAEGVPGAILAARERVLASFDAASSDERALLAGSICGSVTAIGERGLDAEFATCGVSHLVAVSGGHLVLVCAFVGAALDRTRLSPVGRAALLLAATGAFVAFCGAPVSAVRSWAMSLVASLSQLAGRRGHPLSSASVVGLAMALAEPGVTGQLGYLLSVICVCGICVMGGYVRYLVRVLWPCPRLPRRTSAPVRRALLRMGDDAQEALALTLVSQAVTLPLTCATFSQLSLVAPLANVVLSPPFSAMLALGLVAGCLAWAPPAQALVLVGCDACAGAFLGLLRALARLPMASVAVAVDEGTALAALAVAVGALLAWWPQASRASLARAVALALAVALAYVGRWRLLAPACVRVLDVGQGDAILVTDGPAALLVDTGPDDAVVEALARSHVFHLDAVLVTHLHDDHVGGLSDVLATVDADRVLVAEGVSGAVAPDGVAVEEVGYGDVLAVGGFSLRVVSPTGPVDGTENGHSVELALAYDDGSRRLTGLLTGDAEQGETGAAVGRGDVGDTDFLKVGHHGSEASLDAATAEALDPEVSVASAGEGNPYGHPTPACVEVLEGAGSLFLCTMDVGDVCVEPGAEGPRVSCARGPA